jgi:excisionase family DNA binding protein
VLVTGAIRSGRRLLSASELAEALGVSRRWIYLQVEEHSLPAYRLGRSLRFDPDAVYTWLESRRIGAWESCAETDDVVRFL